MTYSDAKQPKAVGIPLIYRREWRKIGLIFIAPQREPVVRFGICGTQSRLIDIAIGSRLIDRGDRPLSRNPATSRSFTVSSGNLRSIANAWWGWEDSNFQPNDYQLLSIEVPEVSEFVCTSVSLRK